MGMEIRIKYHNDVERIERIAVGDWIDLRASQDIIMQEGEFRLIPLGVSMKLPEGYEAHVLPRSSTFKKWGILMVNGMGIIDNSYSGTNDVWQFPALATKSILIKKNDRIAQFRIMEIMPNVDFVECETLDSVDRGGFGSTGTN